MVSEGCLASIALTLKFSWAQGDDPESGDPAREQVNGSRAQTACTTLIKGREGRPGWGRQRNLGAGLKETD